MHGEFRSIGVSDVTERILSSLLLFFLTQINSAQWDQGLMDGQRVLGKQKRA